jgi:NADH:ubiquinone oxidoreductase subunit 5 (subunit L)/multisubunit Na+/H+ antiporter MnhA subunit
MPAERAGPLEWMLLVALYALVGLAIAALAVQVAIPEPLGFAGMGVDRLTAAAALLIAGVGAVTYRFALRAMDGEPGQRRFMRWLFGTVAGALALVVAHNLVLLFAAWSFVSVGLHQLLTFYHDRPQALRPARKKFLISRVGDVALLGAIGVIAVRWGTFDLPAALERAATAPAGETTLVAVLLVLAALTKSAQVPFHSWLPDTMEAPTPVSALMHAGIINAGGVLLLRFAPLVAQVEAALVLLLVIGTLTAVLGTLAMWAQVSVKRALAWSTVSQMGFMMVQCGLGAFPAAALHIVGHGCYKAWAFLRAGELPAPARRTPPADPVRTLRLALVGTVAAVPALALAAGVTGFSPTHSSGELALTAILALSIGQLWVAMHGAPAENSFRRVALLGAATVGVALLAFALYQGAALFLAPVLGTSPVAHSTFFAAVALLPVAALALLIGLHALRLVLPASGAELLAVHARHGFYLGMYADRIVDRVWSTLNARGVARA